MFLGSRVRLVRKADNLTAICEQTVYTMWEQQIHIKILFFKFPTALECLGHHKVR
jgi:hypothetical protein